MILASGYIDPPLGFDHLTVCHMIVLLVFSTDDTGEGDVDFMHVCGVLQDGFEPAKGEFSKDYNFPYINICIKV